MARSIQPAVLTESDCKMTPNPGHGPTSIEFYVREFIPPTPYTSCQRFKDGLAGWWDGRHLSQPQLRYDSAEEQDLILPPWARARQLEYLESAQAETILHNGIVDPYRLEVAKLKASVERLRTDTDKAKARREEVAAQPVGNSVPSGPGEIAVSAAGLASRRAREKRIREAEAAAQQSATEDASASAAARLAELEEKISLAADVLKDRIEACRRHTSRRIAVYARGISRRHPNAPVISALTQELAIEAEHTGQREKPGHDDTPPALALVRT